jgi:DNA polymerase III epsilon subunit-like protein
MKRYITIDNETGGIETDKSLLTVYLGVYDETFQFIDDLYLYLKPPDDAYIVTAEALKINKIDLIFHDTRAIPYKEGATQLYDFLKKNSMDGKIKLLPVGQNVHFDIGHIHEKLLQKKNWDKFVSYRLRDTGVLAGVLQDVGVIPDNVRGSLGSLLDHYNIDVDKNTLHDAKVDAVATLMLYEKMVNQLRTIYNASR